MSSESKKPAARSAVRKATARERIDQTAYALFSRKGIRAVGVDEVVARSGVAKMTLYRHYLSKNELALAFLRRREELWTRAWLQQEVRRLAQRPAEQLLAIFDAFDKWFRRADFEGCSFVNVLLEAGPEEPAVRQAAVAHLATIRAFVRELAAAAGAADAEGLAHEWHILMKGSIVAAAEGDREAARRAQRVGRLLLADHIGERERASRPAAVRRRSNRRRPRSGRQG